MTTGGGLNEPGRSAARGTGARIVSPRRSPHSTGKAPFAVLHRNWKGARISPIIHRWISSLRAGVDALRASHDKRCIYLTREET